MEVEGILLTKCRGVQVSSTTSSEEALLTLELVEPGVFRVVDPASSSTFLLSGLAHEAGVSTLCTILRKASSVLLA
jgi:hypothetical protein